VAKGGLGSSIMRQMRPSPRIAVACVLAGALALAGDTGTLTVSVMDSVTGDLIADASVSIVGSSHLTRVERLRGRSRFLGLPMGTYQVVASSTSRAVKQIKSVTLLSGGPAMIEFVFPAASSMTGKVTDESGLPLSGISVMLVGSEYRYGVLAHAVITMAKTDSQGNYVLGDGVQAGRAYRILALKMPAIRPALSGVARDPKLRDPVVRPTYYPESKSLDGAMSVSAGVGESRRGLDIRMGNSDSYCAEGSVQSSGRVVAATIRLAQPDNMVTLWPTMAPGAFRFCDLASGEYLMSAMNVSGQSETASAAVTIAGQDATGVKLSLARPQRVFVMSNWDGQLP
jgi:hypothetical protein